MFLESAAQATACAKAVCTWACSVTAFGRRGRRMELAEVLISSEAAREEAPAVVSNGLDEASLEAALQERGPFDVSSDNAGDRRPGLPAS